MEQVLQKLTTDWSIIINKFPELERLKEKYVELSNLNIPIYPKQENILKCFNFFDILSTKVVILGQDPYHKENQATGLSFGVENDTKCPPSLRNIKKLLHKNVKVPLKSQNLESWAEQGVLMLNSSLCVIEKKPGSCMKMWSPLCKYLINYINMHCKGVIFIAWGAFAHKMLMDIDQTRHKLLISSHPSPLSANRGYKEYPSFMNSTPFLEINKIYPEIKW